MKTELDREGYLWCCSGHGNLRPIAVSENTYLGAIRGYMEMFWAQADEEAHYVRSMEYALEQEATALSLEHDPDRRWK